MGNDLNRDYKYVRRRGGNGDCRQFQKRTRKNKAMQSGLQSLLRAEIIRQHEKYTDRGYCPIYAKDALRREYESYHLLGGNGVITDLYNDLIALPEFPSHPDNENKTED